jgi:tetrahydromethanopterin S-methyltransferase subunit H
LELKLSYKARVKILNNLIPRAVNAGIKKIIVDTVVMDVPTLGLACKAISEIKDLFGFPTGCGAHNAVDSWKALKEKNDKLLSSVCAAVINGFPISIGADFILFGPINRAKYVFPSIAVLDAAFGQILLEEGKRPDIDHPRFKIGGMWK